MFRITSEPLEEEKQKYRNQQAGAFVCFEGRVRNHNEGRSVDRLEYEAYEELAIKEAERIFAEAKERFGVLHVWGAHRVGVLELEEVAVWIGVLSAHRDEAFKACRYAIDEIKTRLPIWKKEWYSEGDSEWVNCQRCAQHTHTSHESQFYSGQQNVSFVGEKGQQILKNSHVFVIGAGGLGCPVLLQLAGSGVGHITVFDGDELELSNLHRQSLYNYDDIGQNKAKLAKDKIMAYNPFIHVEAIPEKVDKNNLEELFKNKKIDVIVDCTDNFPAKFLLHDACREFNLLLVQASVYQTEGELQVFTHEPDESCLRCLWPEIPNCAQSCSETGVLPSAPAVLGSFQAMECVKLLLGKDSPAQNNKQIIDLNTYEIQSLRIPKSKGCLTCQGKTSFRAKNYQPFQWDWELSLGDLHTEDFNDLDLVDIRDIDPEKIKKLPSNKRYLLICDRGIRSQRLVKKLREKNSDYFYSLQGGLQGAKAQDINELRELI